MKKKGRGLSYDEKKQKMLKIFHQTKGVFNYQEIQKLSIKVGIPFPNVKQILNALKADSLVQCQKIGAGVFYWSFPSRALQIVGYYRAIRLCMKNVIQQDREQKQQQLRQLLQKRQKLNEQIQKMIRFDPQRIQTLKKQNNQLKLNINKQTDNLQQIKKYIKKQQIGIKNQDIQIQYGIPVDLEYIQ